MCGWVNWPRSTWPYWVDWAVKPQHKQTNAQPSICHRSFFNERDSVMCEFWSILLFRIHPCRQRVDTIKHLLPSYCCHAGNQSYQQGYMFGRKTRRFTSHPDMVILRLRIYCCVTVQVTISYLKKGGGIRKLFFLFLHENICCWYSSEVPHQGASNEYPQHNFLWKTL